MNFILYILVRLDYDRWCQSQIHIYKMFIIHSSAKRNKKKKKLAACQGSSPSSRRIEP